MQQIETTALAACALLRARQHAATTDKAIGWLIEQKDSRGTWHSTQATVHAMRALLAGVGSRGRIEGTLNVAVTANGKLAKNLTITPETSDVYRLISLRPFVKHGVNRVALETSGEGNLAYQIVATHYVPWPRGGARPEAKKELSIDVAYETKELKTDDILTAHVTIRYNQAGVAGMTIVDLGVPPGFEVVPDALAGLKDRGVIERYSITGRQIILSFRELRSGEPVRFEVKLRAKFPVEAKTPRSVVYRYYEPEVRDEAPPVVLTVM